MKIRNKLLLAITVPVGLLILQIALVNVFIRESQEAVTFISVTHKTIEDAFSASDLVSDLREEAKRLPSSFVSNRATDDEGLATFHQIFSELELRTQSIVNTETASENVPTGRTRLQAALHATGVELSQADELLAAPAVDMDTLLERAIFLDAALVNVSTALDELTRELRFQLLAAVDREREIHDRPVIAGIAIGGLSVLMLLIFTWLVVDRYFVARLTRLSKAMLSIAEGDLDTTLPPPKGNDEVDEMSRTIETFRITAQERNALLTERAKAAERLEKEVAERTKELETANNFKTRFLAAASHDLRQPLHALNLFIGQLRARPKLGERRRLEEKISEAATSTNELFDALLDMTKLEAGVIVPEITSFPISTVFQRLDATFATAASNRGVRFGVVSSAYWTTSDPILLERILLNLVSNAVRATSKGGVLVGCRRRGDMIRIDVCDTGPGIPMDKHDELFKEFVRLGPSNSSNSESLGLGLSIVDGLAQLLNHRVELSTIPGRGTRFSVYVPLVDATTLPFAEPDTALSFEPLSGRRVLVIEDDALVRESMAGLLGSWGCHVTLAEGVVDGVEVVRGSQIPDLIISDFRLSDGHTGLDAIAKIQQLSSRDIPAFLVTAETDVERLSKAARSGYPILHKPVTPMALRALATQLLKGG